MRDWDRYFIDTARHTATMSTCFRRNVGAVVVRDRHIVSCGFNGNVPGAQHCTDGGCDRCANWRRAGGDDFHVCVCVHAEQNAVAWCARSGAQMDGSTVYTTHRPCLDCVKLLAVAGVSEVVFAEWYPADYEVPPTLTMRQYAP